MEPERALEDVLAPVGNVLLYPTDCCKKQQQQQQLISRAEQLLQTAQKPEESWGTLSDAQLDLEIARFRACITEISAGLSASSAAGDGGGAERSQQAQGAGAGPARAGSVHERPTPSHGPHDAAAATAAVGSEERAAGPSGGGEQYEVGSVDDLDPREWQVPPHCIPIHANVTTYDWAALYNHAQFDVIMMDPPWQLATANPTRGVSLGYSQLTDADIAALPVPQLQRDGFLFVWVINAKYKWTLDLFDKWGYKMVDEIVWVKMTVNRRLAKSHGYYLQHAKEVCLVGKRGSDPPGMTTGGVGSDVIFSERRGQSQKPEEMYELIEELVPNGRYLEIFARKNNLRNYWVSIGNEVTGTGLPEADLNALKQSACIPNAVYGRGTTR